MYTTTLVDPAVYTQHT